MYCYLEVAWDAILHLNVVCVPSANKPVFGSERS